MKHAWRVLGLIVFVAVAQADGLPGGEGPCDDIDACKQACSKSAAACTWGGHLLIRMGREENKQSAIALYQKGCTKGDGEGCWYAGMFVDRARSRALFDRACAKQIIRGCFALAKLDGAAGDAKAKRAAVAAMQRAITIYKARCTKKDAAACDQAAGLYTTGLDKPDEKNAAAFRERACRIRTGAACPPPPPPPPPDNCLKDATVARDAEKAANAANDKRFAGELAKQKLQPIELHERRWRDTDLDVGGRPAKWTLDAVQEVRFPNGPAAKLIVGFDSSGGCGVVSRSAEYVRRDNRIYRVVRAPKSISSQAFRVCGCGTFCGGARPGIYHVGYEVPADATFEGPITVAYDADDVQLTFSQGAACSRGP